MPEDIRMPVGGKLTSPGPYLAKIISHLDPTYMGGLQVQLMQEVGNDDSKEGQLHQVKYLSPFLGQTSIDFVGDDVDDYNNTQKSYGMWAIPPDIGNIVVVIFIDGDPKKGYWIGCVQDKGINFTMPGYAATSYNLEGTAERLPVGEYNKKSQASGIDPTQIKKPVSPLKSVLESQGLLLDDIRGITTSSARREIPSSVFGISTPGPIDKRSGAKQGPVGKDEYKIPNAFVSRLGGSSFVMDDGDDKFIRKTTPSEGPPEYSSLEQGETEGKKDIPHNELIRLRTRTGHQILLHNSEDLIYIGNSRGTAWIELTSDGKMEVYCEDSISFRTKEDFNFYADRDINLEAGRNLNIKVAGEMHTHAVADHILIVDANQKIHIKGDKDITVDGGLKHTVKGEVDIAFASDYRQTNSANYDLKTGGDNKFTAGGATDIKSGGNHTETAAQIHMNGPGAAAAAAAAEAVKPLPLSIHSLADLTSPSSDVTVKNTILRRMPTPEPYPLHENLDPVRVKPSETDRDKDGRYEPATTDMSTASELWKTYSTVTDTFSKVSGE
jgi:hypothetical protein